jgi:hypothetical protein
VRNKLVHTGASFTDIKEADSNTVAETVRILIMSKQLLQGEWISTVSYIHLRNGVRKVCGDIRTPEIRAIFPNR